MEKLENFVGDQGKMTSIIRVGRLML